VKVEQSFIDSFNHINDKTRNFANIARVIGGSQELNSCTRCILYSLSYS